MNNENWYYDNTTGCVCSHNKVIVKIINHETQDGQDNAWLITHTHELFDIVRELAQCKPHDFSLLKLHAGELLEHLREVHHD